MASTVTPFRAPADTAAREAVTPSDHYGYKPARPCTLRQLSNGRWGVFTFDNATQDWHLICADDRRDRAQASQYQLVNNSDDLCDVHTCEYCWDVVPLSRETVWEGYRAFCSEEHRRLAPQQHRERFPAVVVFSAIVLFVITFWYGLEQAALAVIRHYFPGVF